MSSLKIGIGIFIAFILLGIVATIIVPETDTNTTSTVGSSGTQQSSQQSSQQEVETTTEAVTPIATHNKKESSDSVKTTNTYHDAEWVNVVGADTKPVTAALEDLTTSMNNFASTKNMSPAATAAEDLYDSTQTAILNSNSYAVSPDLQPIKDEYNQAMSDYNLASAYVYQAVKEYNNGNMNQSASLLEDATYCIDSANSHINTAQKSLRVYSKKMGVTTNL